MPMSIEELIAKIKDPSDPIRAEGWTNAGPCGARAVKPLAAIVADAQADREVARAAQRALWTIVRFAGGPDADDDRPAVAAEITTLLAPERGAALRRDACWMLSEIGGAPEVPALAALLSDREVREDARCALERIPGPESLAALESALAAAEESFRPALAQSLRARGVAVPGIPCLKLTPKAEAAVGT